MVPSCCTGIGTQGLVYHFHPVNIYVRSKAQPNGGVLDAGLAH